MPRIISRAEGGIVPLTHTTDRVVPGAKWLLLHHTGDTGWPKAGWSDAKHMAALQAFSSGVGKTWEYNYVITHPGGWIWEQAGGQRAAHCLNANGFSYGVQINQASSAGLPPQALIDSFRWLRAELVRTGQLAPDHQLVPHYGLRATACSSIDLAQPPQGRRPNSPTGQGSLGNVHPQFAVPWQPPPPPYDPWNHQYAPFWDWQPKPTLSWLHGWPGSPTEKDQGFCAYLNHVLIFECGQGITVPYGIVTGEQPDNPNTPIGEGGTIWAMRNAVAFFNPTGANVALADEAKRGVCGPEMWKLIDAIAHHFGLPR